VLSKIVEVSLAGQGTKKTELSTNAHNCIIPEDPIVRRVESENS